MEYVTLRNGFKLPMIGFGTYPLKGKQLEDTLKLAVDAGYELYDSAHLYKNEQDIGNCLKKGILNRENIILTSKVQGVQFSGRRRWLYLDKISVAKAYRMSCRKFGVDSIDVYLLHSPSRGYVKAYKELMQLYTEKKVKAIGVSNFNIKELESLYQECGEYPLINQIEVHPYNTMSEIVEFCKKHDIQAEAYSPFGRGNIVSEIMNNSQLKEIASAHGKMVGQVVLRWIVQQNIITIPRSTNAERMKQNLDVFDFTLADDEMQYVFSLNRDYGYGHHFQHK